MKPPVLASRLDPAYVWPKSGKAELTLLILEIVVMKDGRVRDGRLLKDPDGVSPENVSAALAAVRQLRYSPATLHGEPVDVYLTISLLHVPGRPVA